MKQVRVPPELSCAMIDFGPGSVWVNSHFDVDPKVPFGGHKESGLGMEWGMEGLKHYTNSRSLWVWKKVFE